MWKQILNNYILIIVQIYSLYACFQPFYSVFVAIGSFQYSTFSHIAALHIFRGQYCTLLYPQEIIGQKWNFFYFFKFFTSISHQIFDVWISLPYFWTSQVL